MTLGVHSPDNERLAAAAGVRHLVMPTWGRRPRSNGRARRSGRGVNATSGARASKGGSVVCGGTMGCGAVRIMAPTAWNGALAGA